MKELNRKAVKWPTAVAVLAGQRDNAPLHIRELVGLRPLPTSGDFQCLDCFSVAY